MSSSETLIFYEKPGCINNRKQVKLLLDANVNLERRDLITSSISVAELRRFFSDLPREQWLNPNAPALNAGKIVPGDLTEDQLLDAMCQDRLLIRRPLIQFNNKCWAGFEWDRVCQELGIPTNVGDMSPNQDLETCVRTRATT